MLSNSRLRQAALDLPLWLPIGLIPIANAVVRLATYEAVLGPAAAGWLSALSDAALILVYAALVGRPRSVGQRAATWLLCTTILHFALGTLAFAMPLSELAGKYDLLAGEPWLLVNVAIALAPWLGAWTQRQMAARRSRLLVLVGPKGCGKSTIGRMIEARFDAHFLDVERIALRVLRCMGGIIDETYARRAFEEIARTIRTIERDYPTILMETTGASEETAWFLDKLRSRYDVRLIRIRSGAETCTRRIKSRNQTRQIAVSEDLIREMHARSEALQLPWDADLDNDRGLTEDEIAALVRPHMRRVPKDPAPGTSGGGAFGAFRAGETA